MKVMVVGGGGRGGNEPGHVLVGDQAPRVGGDARVPGRAQQFRAVTGARQGADDRMFTAAPSYYEDPHWCAAGLVTGTW